MPTQEAQTLSPEEVRSHRATVEQGIEWVETRFRRERAKFQRLLNQLQDTQCPHANMDGGSYTRWCTDCGKSWDTT